MQPYIKLASKPSIVVRLLADNPQTVSLFGWQSVHGVPEIAVQRCHKALEIIRPDSGAAELYCFERCLTEESYNDCFLH